MTAHKWKQLYYNEEGEQMPSWVVSFSEKWLFSFSQSLISTCRLGQTSTVTLQRWILYVLFAGSIRLRYWIGGLLSLKLDNPTHKYSFHYSWFYIWITKRINAQMPLNSLRHPREKGGGLRMQGPLLACATNYEGWQNIRTLKGPLFYLLNTLPIPVITVSTLCFQSTF